MYDGLNPVFYLPMMVADYMRNVLTSTPVKSDAFPLVYILFNIVYLYITD